MNFYEALNLKPEATVEEIEQAYRQLARKVHPDFHQDDANASEDHMKMLNLIRDTLIDPERRVRYDAELLRSSQASEAGFRKAKRFVSGWALAWSNRQLAIVIVAGLLLGVALGGSLWFHRRLSVPSPPLPTNQPISSPPSASIPEPSAPVTPTLKNPAVIPSKPKPQVVQLGSNLNEILQVMGNPDRVEEDSSHNLRVLYYGKLRLILKNGKLVQGLTQP